MDNGTTGRFSRRPRSISDVWYAVGCLAAELRDYCRDNIAHYKIPRYIKFVEAFPTTVTGKVQKFIMRQVVEEQLGLKPDETA
jgi:fatty-acyl-CoA synthase